jgi:malonate decarboxylase gamma subunit
MNEHVGLRGRTWFKLLTGSDTPQAGDPHSVLATNVPFGNEVALFLCVVPNPESRFPCVRDGQVGLEEAYALAIHTRERHCQRRQQAEV